MCFQDENGLFGTGLRGVVFVASILDFETAGRRNSESRMSGKGFERMFGFSPSESHSTNVEHHIRVRAEAIKLWQKAQSIAIMCEVPCFLILTKQDLLEHSKAITSSTSPSQAIAMLQAQYVASVPPEQAEGTEQVRTVEEDEAKHVVRKAKQIDSLVIDCLDANRVNEVTDIVLHKSFPEIECDDEATGAFGEAIHICLCFYGSLDGVLLSKCNVLPVAKWQNQVLRISDHAWLRQLPNPIPNPKSCTEDLALRLGKNSPCPTRAQFWQALLTLVDQLGGFEPATLGTIHLSPLLTSSGALLIVIRQDFETAPSLSSLKVRKLKWRPIGQVASKLARVAQAAELEVYRCAGQLSSYAPEVREMLANTPARDLLPNVWLERLLLACGATSRSLSPGTYVVAMNTRSTRDGLQVLVPVEQDLGAMPPAVKVSEHYVSSEDWATLCEIGDAAKRGEAASSVPKNWAAAKGWMGPDVGTEKQFTMLQKFYFGVLGLRQMLERQCTATRDQLRYSKPMGPTHSISALGHLCTKDIILADPDGRVQLVLICKHHNAIDDTAFPKDLRWIPFPLFEAQHFARYMPEPYDALVMGLDLKQRCAAVQDKRAHASDALRDSLRDSIGSLRASTLAEQSNLSKLRTSSDQKPQRILVEIPLQTDLCVLEEAWNALRWTRWVVRTMCLNDASEVTAMIVKRIGERRSSRRPSESESSMLPFRKRAEHHKSLYKTTLSSLAGHAEASRTKLAQLSVVIHGIEHDDENDVPVARRKLSYET